MGLMFARRRMEEAAKRAANKSKAQAERHAEATAKHKAEAIAEVQKGGKDGTKPQGTK